MEPLGTFAFVLHTHLPYCRNAGRWPHGEEWLYEAATETYLPLLETLADLARHRTFTVTLSLTPVLADQLAAPAVLANLAEYIEDRGNRARADLARFELRGEAQYAALARYYADWYDARLWAFRDRFEGDLIGALRRLRESGHVEIITSGATHPYLPLLSRDSSVYAQVRAGVASYQRTFSDSPDGFWLPECGYRPATVEGDGTRRPGLEEFLAAQGILFTFVESHAIEGGAPPTGCAHLAPCYAIACGARDGRPLAGPTEGYTTSLPYLVGDSNLAVVGRNRRLSMQVWSAGQGYPGDAAYREFHKRDSVSGMQYWRITGPGTGLGDKGPYDPRLAGERVRQHAAHFASLVVDELAQHAERQRGPGLVAAVFDTELFGHWWHEGPDWLRLVLEQLGSDGRVSLRGVAEHLEAYPPTTAIRVPASSWGAAGDDRTWLNPQTEEMWARVHRCEAALEQTVAESPAGRERFLQQTCREALLAQSSDWPFLITTGQASEYARQRFDGHCERFRLLDCLARADLVSGEEAAYLERTESTDQLFSFLRPEWFTARQGRSS